MNESLVIENYGSCPYCGLAVSLEVSLTVHIVQCVISSVYGSSWNSLVFGLILFYFYVYIFLGILSCLEADNIDSKRKQRSDH